MDAESSALEVHLAVGTGSDILVVWEAEWEEHRKSGSGIGSDAELERSMGPSTGSGPDCRVVRLHSSAAIDSKGGGALA